jgi:hypothetical protein
MIRLDVLKEVTDKDLERIHDAIYTAWANAEQEQKDNSTVAMYCIGNREGEKRTNWIETYLVDTSGFGEPEPPGDCYHVWGYQEGSTEIPEDIREILKKKMEQFQKKIRCKNWIAELTE